MYNCTFTQKRESTHVWKQQSTYTVQVFRKEHYQDPRHRAFVSRKFQSTNFCKNSGKGAVFANIHEYNLNIEGKRSNCCSLQLIYIIQSLVTQRLYLFIILPTLRHNICYNFLLPSIQYWHTDSIRNNMSLIQKYDIDTVLHYSTLRLELSWSGLSICFTTLTNFIHLLSLHKYVLYGFKSIKKKQKY